MKMIKIGLIGLGNVGQSVYTIIADHQDEIVYKTGFKLEIACVLVRDAKKDRGITLENSLLTENPLDILDDTTIDIVVETAGGVSFAYDIIKKALACHKHVITANKDLMALHGSELLSLAKNNHCDLFYEGSVGGGIPIIRSLQDGLAADKITEISGIINGTTNYILTRMDHDGMTYEDALNKAQALGFAESDPTADVGGFDAGRKMAILANQAFSMPIDVNDVSIRGLEDVTDSDLAFAKQLGYEMKLLGIAKMSDGAVEVSVQPTLIPHAHPLTSVHDEYNAVYVRGEAVGTTMFYGPGAGGPPTATAIISDIITVVKNIALGTTGRQILAPRNEKCLKADDAIFAKYFIRLEVEDEVGVFAGVTALFAKYGISFEKIIQDPICEACHAQIVIVTHSVSLLALNHALNGLRTMPLVTDIKSFYRIEIG